MVQIIVALVALLGVFGPLVFQFSGRFRRLRHIRDLSATIKDLPEKTPGKDDLVLALNNDIQEYVAFGQRADSRRLAIWIVVGLAVSSVSLILLGVTLVALNDYGSPSVFDFPQLAKLPTWVRYVFGVAMACYVVGISCMAWGVFGARQRLRQSKTSAA